MYTKTQIDVLYWNPTDADINLIYFDTSDSHSYHFISIVNHSIRFSNLQPSCLSEFRGAQRLPGGFSAGVGATRTSQSGSFWTQKFGSKEKLFDI